MLQHMIEAFYWLKCHDDKIIIRKVRQYPIIMLKFRFFPVIKLFSPVKVHYVVLPFYT